MIYVYLIGGLLLISGGFWGGYHWESADLQKYKAEVAQETIAAQAAYTAALKAQVEDRNRVEANNEKVIGELQAKSDHAAADLLFANRLLDAARKVRSANPAAPKAPDQPRASDPPETSGDGSTPDLAGLTAGAAGECRDAINQLIALQAEIKPQVSP